MNLRKIDELGREVERLSALVETLIHQRDESAEQNRDLRYKLSKLEIQAKILTY